MTVSEFSNGFDLLVNSYRRFKDFDNQELLDSIEFDEFEKSYYLTRAQEDLVVSLYNGKNSTGESFEQTEELRRYLSTLVKEATLLPDSTITFTGMSPTSKFFELPEDLWFITYEAASTDDGTRCEGMGPMDVVPVTQDEYHKIKRNPFRGANARRALRLDLSDGFVEVVSKYNISSYYVRYIEKLSPIVLVNLPSGLTVEGVGTVKECVLHEALHQKILELAVLTALRSKGISMPSSRSGQRETTENR